MKQFFSSIFEIAVLGFFIWTIYKVWKDYHLSGKQKLLYTLALLFLPLIGLIAYWAYGHRSYGSRSSFSNYGSRSSSSDYLTQSNSPASNTSKRSKSTKELLSNGPEVTDFYRDAPTLYTLPDHSNDFLITDPFMSWGGWLQDMIDSGEDNRRIFIYTMIADDHDDDFFTVCCQAGCPDCYRTRISIQNQYGGPISSGMNELSEEWKEISFRSNDEKQRHMRVYDPRHLDRISPEHFEPLYEQTVGRWI